MNQKIRYSKMYYQQAKYIDIYIEFCVLSKECNLQSEESHKSQNYSCLSLEFRFQARLQAICKNNTYFSVDFTRAHFLKLKVKSCKKQLNHLRTPKTTAKCL